MIHSFTAKSLWRHWSTKMVISIRLWRAQIREEVKLENTTDTRAALNRQK